MRWTLILILTGCVVSGCKGCARSPDPPSIGGAFLTAIETIDIANSNGHIASTDAVRLSDGRILLVYREGRAQVEPSGRIIHRLGTPDGKTWSGPSVLLDTPGVDDREPSLTLLPDGRLLMSFFVFRRKVLAAGMLLLHQPLVAISETGSESFGEPISVSKDPDDLSDAHIGPDGRWRDANGEPIHVASTSSPVILHGERLLLPADSGPPLNLGAVESSPRSRISIFISEDLGATWIHRPVNPNVRRDLWLQEPSLVALDNGDLLLHVRTAEGDSPSGAGPLSQARSRDGGISWSAWQLLGITGHSPYLCQLPNGTLVSAFREIDQTIGQVRISLMTSEDSGHHWSEPQRLEQASGEAAGSPTVVPLGENRLLVIYYAASGHVIRGKIVAVGPRT